MTVLVFWFFLIWVFWGFCFMFVVFWCGFFFFSPRNFLLPIPWYLKRSRGCSDLQGVSLSGQNEGGSWKVRLLWIAASASCLKIETKAGPQSNWSSRTETQMKLVCGYCLSWAVCVLVLGLWIFWWPLTARCVKIHSAGQGTEAMQVLHCSPCAGKCSGSLGLCC